MPNTFRAFALRVKAQQQARAAMHEAASVGRLFCLVLRQP